MASALPRWPRAAWLFCLAASLGCIHGPRLGSAPWLEVESEHFVLRGDLGPDEAKEAVLNLERVRRGLLHASWHAATQPPAKTHVILLADEAELDEYVRRGVLGYSAVDPFEAPLLVASASQRLDELTVLKHEMAHTIDNVFLLRQPRWLSEGLASYLETLQLNADGTRVKVGEANETRIAPLQRRRSLNLAWVMGVGPEIYSLRQSDLEEFYAVSWLLVDYLANARREQLSAWFDRLARAEEPQPAWEKVFGKELGPAQLEPLLLNYLRHGRFNTYRFDLPPLEAQVTSRPLPQADVLAELALLRSISFGELTPQTQAQAASEAEAALKADPHSALAAGIWNATGERAQPAQVAAARAVIAGHPDDSRGYELLGLALGPAAAKEQLEAFETAVRLSPDDARALAHLSFGYLTVNREKEALAAARKAVALAPGNPNYLDALALALAANGLCADAPTLEERAIEMVPDSAAPQQGERLQQRLGELAQVCKARQAGEHPRFVPAEEGTTPAAAAGPCANPGLKLTQKLLGGQTSLTVEFTVAPDGQVTEVAIPHAAPALLEQVRGYLKSCPFKPARAPSGPVSWPMSITFTFEPAPH